MNDLSAKIEHWRRLAVEGKFSLEEQIAAIQALRDGRHAAASETPTARTRAAKKAIPTAADLLADLGDDL